MDTKLTIVVPTINSAGWISDLHYYYQSLGLSPLYCIDNRTSDDTAAVLSRLGARFAVVTTDYPRVEAMVLHFTHIVSTPWILRVDDDECPSAELIEWIKSNDCEFAKNMVSTVHRWLRLNAESELEFFANESWNRAGSENGEDRHLRLYRKDEVTYVSDIHTPGFIAEDAVEAPIEACLYHFSWILRSKAERTAKMIKYDEQQPGAGFGKARYYIPEDVKSWDYTGRITANNIIALAHKLRFNETSKNAKSREQHAMRYDQLLSLVAVYKPRSIVEIGTNQGDRGILLCREALRHNPVVSYTGYDVFDTKDEEFHKQVFNGKGAFAKELVAARFNEIKSQHPGFQFELHQGMTTETLHPHDVRADFVFIDGDHRVQTIALDYTAVKHSKVVVFDDYYSDAPGCEKIDTNVFGCNSIIDQSKAATILPNADRFPATGDIRMAALIRRHIFVRGKPIWF